LVNASFAAWAKKELATGGSETTIFAKGVTATHTGVYLALVGFFELVGPSKFMQQFKLPRTKAQEPTFAMKRKVLLEHFINQLVSYFLILPLGHRAFVYFGQPSALSPLPSLIKMAVQYSFASIFNKFVFAIAHRIFHHGPLYRMFHKKHHEFVGTVAMAAENAHPVEDGPFFPLFCDGLNREKPPSRIVVF
jgi:sterol desaturase/sphingolipid hydroxylase (fatty acid hydroxylase superfamily)